MHLLSTLEDDELAYA